jgi:hypothetical protein
LEANISIWQGTGHFYFALTSPKVTTSSGAAAHQCPWTVPILPEPREVQGEWSPLKSAENAP